MKYQSALFAAAAALVLGTQVARAEEPEKDKEKPARGFNKERFLEKFDTNKDGALSKEELEAAPERARTNALEKGDTNKDGALSKEEIEAIKSEAKPKKEDKEKK